jgi:hypothetical protein
MTSLATQSKLVAGGHSLPSSQPPYTRLYPQVLGCIFDFLSFDDVHTAMRTNCEWRKVVCTMPALTDGKRLSCPGPKLFASILASPLARHVIGLFVLNRIDSARWTELAFGLPFLREIWFSVFSADPWEPSKRLPSSLQSVYVTFSRTFIGADVISGPSDSTINAVISTLSQLPLMNTLDIQVSSPSSAVTFAPLQHARSLTSLHITKGPEWSREALHPNHMLQIRQMQQLSHVDIRPCSRQAFMDLLLHDSSPLSWKGLIHPNMRIDDALVSLLPTVLPRIEHLPLRRHDLQRLHNFRFLPKMASLRKLFISCVGCNGRRQTRVVKMLDEMTEPLPLLQHLIFCDIPLDSTQLQRWLTLTPRLSVVCAYDTGASCTLSV